MRKIVLFLFTFCAIIVSCDKQVQQPLNYSVSNDVLQTGVLDIYIPDNGTYNMQVLVKFLSGYAESRVTLQLSGLPANVTVSPAKYTDVPTFTRDFLFTTTNAALGITQATLTTSTSGQAPKVYNFNIHVIPANCATYFGGTLSASNACAVNYTYIATGTVDPTSSYVLYINNFGGYGPTVNAQVVLNCENRTLSVPSQNIGNGTRIQGTGTFTLNTMTIRYTAYTTPTGPGDNCTATFTK
jgi:hypothetical protein